MAATDDVIPSGSSTRVRIELVRRHAGQPFQHQPHELVRVVRVPEVRSRSERRRDPPHERRGSEAGRRVFRSGREAARVRQEVMHRDRAERFRQLQPRQELVHGDVQVQPTGLHLLERDDRCEGLGDRADHEPGLRANGGSARDVGEPADDDPEDLVTVGDRDRRSRGVRHGEVMLERQSDPIEGFGEPRQRATPRGRTTRARARPRTGSRCRARCSRRSAWRSRRGSSRAEP